MINDHPVQIRRVCEICGADDYRTLGVDDSQPVVQCRSCGFVYANPVPAESRLTEYYDHAYQDVNEWARRLQHDRAKVFSTVLKRIKRVRKGGRLLDVGCSLGIFSELAHEQGFDVYGVDISTPAARYAREKLGIPTIRGTIGDVLKQWQNIKFDIVTYLDVLEHVTAPFGILRASAEVMARGALLVVRVPNANFHVNRFRLVQALFGRGFLDSKNHLNHFSPTTLGLLLQKAHFHVLHILPGAPTLYGRIGIDTAKKALHQMAMASWATTKWNLDTIIEAYAVRE